jgi:hypothetical protein
MPGSRVEGDMTGQDPRAALQHMCETNAALEDSGGDVWQWMAGLYGRDAVMAIRRERDGQAGILNLFQLLHDMEAYSHILTRVRYRGSLAELPQFPTRLIDEQFEQCGGPPGPGTPDDHIPAAAIAEDRAHLQHETSHRGARSSAGRSVCRSASASRARGGRAPAGQAEA